MIGCLIGFLFAILVAVVVLWVVEWGLAQLGAPIPPQIINIVRVIVALILLLMALQCVFGSGAIAGTGWRPGRFFGCGPCP